MEEPPTQQPADGEEDDPPPTQRPPASPGPRLERSGVPVLFFTGELGAELLIGRVGVSAYVLEDVKRDPAEQRASRMHAKIIKEARGWVLTDLKSAWGTTINGVSVPAGLAADLFEDDLVEFGQGNGVEKYDGLAHVVKGVGHQRPPPPPQLPVLGAVEMKYMENMKAALELGLNRLGQARATNNLAEAWSAGGGVVLSLKKAAETLQLRNETEARERRTGEGREERLQRRHDEHNQDTGTKPAKKRREKKRRGRGGNGGVGGGVQMNSGGGGQRDNRGVQKPEWRGLNGGRGGRGGRSSGGKGGKGGKRGGGQSGSGGKEGNGGGSRVNWSGK